MIRYRNLNHAIAAIVVDNRGLIACIGRHWNYFVNRGEEPVGMEPLSKALNCERNDAHRHLEELIAALARIGRGRIPRRPVLELFALSSRKLLLEVLRMAGMLDDTLDMQADALRHAADRAMVKEDEFVHFVLDESGGRANMSSEEFECRLGKFVRDLKRCFGAVAIAVEDVEVAINRRRMRKPARRRKTAGRNGSVQSAASAMLRSDMKAICTEVCRRWKAKRRGHVNTTLRQELEHLYRDAAWSRRCRQWNEKTLYTYLCRR